MALQQSVIIAGGGPVGVVTALALAQKGIPVRVYEAGDQVNADAEGIDDAPGDAGNAGVAGIAG